MPRAPLRPSAALSLLLCPLLAGCSGGPGPEAPAGPPAARTPPGALVDHLEERALLLLLADRRTYEPLVVRRTLAGPPDLRRELAVTLGRAGSHRGVDPLLGLLVDDEVEVRRAAAFALGELGEELTEVHESLRRRAAVDLLRATRDPDREVGVLAVEALGKLGVTVAQVAGALADGGAEGEGALSEAERLARMLPSLWRFPDPEAPALALRGLELGDPALQRAAAYALTLNPRAEAVDSIRTLVAEGGEPRDGGPVRAWAARALGIVGGAGDLDLLLPLLDAAEEGPVIEALRAGRTLVASGRAAADAAWRPPLSELLDDPRPGVRRTAIDTAGAWLLDEELGDRLAAIARGTPRPPHRPGNGGRGREGAPLASRAGGKGSGDLEGDPKERAPLASREGGKGSGDLEGDPKEGSGDLAGDPVERSGDLAGDPVDRGAALLALATGGDPRAEELAARAAGDAEPRVRAAAAEAAGVLAAAGLLDRLADDPEPPVRQAVLASRLALAASAGGGEAAVAAGGLEDADPGVRAAALEWLGDHPVLSVPILAEAVARSLGNRVVEERLAAVDAVAARGAALGAEGSGDRGEREAAVALLEPLAGGADYPTRVRAAAGLAALGRPRPAVGPVAPAETGRPTTAVYRRVVLETREPRTVEMTTSRGAVRIRLACPRAPLTCVNFLRLAEQGFYDGLELHRVVPHFVVQGGDPRGDGWGGPGYTIRDEVNRLRYGAGVVGMALAGPDTGGSQFFVTLSEQPRLDGGYTAFGEVVEGMEVLGRIVPGDRIESIRHGGRQPDRD